MPKIFLFGAIHSFDPNHPQFTEIKKQWQEFLGVAKNTPKIAVVESYPSSETYENEESAIHVGGEIGLVTFLARKENIEVTCPEPDRKSQFHFLAQDFSKENIALYFFARPAGQWYRKQGDKPTLEEYIKSFIQRDKDIANWSDFDYSYENLVNIYTHTTSKTVEETSPNEWIDLVNPFIEKYPTNKVANALHHYRNNSIIQNIKKHFEAGNSLFIVYGSGHIESLRKGLEI